MYTERINQIARDRKGNTYTKHFSPLPEYAPLDRDGTRLQLNWLFWNFHMGFIGQKDFENKVVDVLQPMLKVVLGDKT